MIEEVERGKKKTMTVKGKSKRRKEGKNLGT